MWDISMITKIYIHGYELRLTCYAYPEQYDVFEPDGTQVGYIRLRHGTVRAHCPDYDGKVVYTASTIGDGTFNSSERMKHLYKAVEFIQQHIINLIHENGQKCESVDDDVI